MCILFCGNERGAVVWTLSDFSFLPVHICGTLSPSRNDTAVVRQSRRCCSLCCRSDEKSGGGPCPQERCLAGAYFGWACPNKHGETLQPQLRASPWLTSRVLWLLHSQRRERKQASEREREPARPSQSLQRLGGPNAAYYQSRVFPTPAGPLMCSRRHAWLARKRWANSSTVILPPWPLAVFFSSFCSPALDD